MYVAGKYAAAKVVEQYRKIPEQQSGSFAN
jgi:hypothetical protein